MDAIQDLVFHFNKSSVTNPDIPAWVFKVAGETYYVRHAVFTNVSFQTKETPDNPHTKGSIKIKGRLRIENEIAYVTA